MKLYRTTYGGVVERDGRYFRLPCDATDRSWDDLIKQTNLCECLEKCAGNAVETAAPEPSQLRAPIGSQEVWAAGVTYFRSRDARTRECLHGPTASLYEAVYDADRPELFFKATPGRVVGPETDLAIRRDSLSSVPEPELTLLITPAGHITAYTIGNDMTARSLEGENLLYLPQAKIWDRCCALGPCLLVTNDPLPASTEITLLVERDGSVVFRGSTDLSQMKRQFTSLVSYLFRHNSFASGCFLLTGTGIVPPDSFCLTVGDLISISISGIGTLTNVVA